METNTIDMSNSAPLNVAPLSDEEARAYALLVEEGGRLREPIVRRRAEERKAREERMVAAGKRPIRSRSSANTMAVVPDDVRRWVVMRFAGVSFKKAGEMSGSSWTRVQEAKAHSEEFRCALAAQEENSRRLMKAKALSVMELSQDEGAKVSLPQAQLAMKILSSLDREHFGEDRAVRSAESADAPARIGGGGFVINVIGDAASVASKPAERNGRALVYSDV